MYNALSSPIKYYTQKQKFIKENEDKWNPDYNDTLNRNELSELLSNYGTVNVKDLQGSFINNIHIMFHFLVCKLNFIIIFCSNNFA